MKLAYVASPEYGCPAPVGKIQAALWVAQQVIEGMTERGHETIYIGVDGSTVHATHSISMGKGFHDVYPYEEYVTFSEDRRFELFENYRSKLFAFLVSQMKSLDVDILHFHTSPPIGHLPYAEYIHSPKVSTFHDRLYPEYAKLFQEYAHVPNNNFVSISNAQKRELPEINFLDTIYNGIPLLPYGFSNEIGSYALHLGRLKQIKGTYDAFIAAKQAGIPIIFAGRPGVGDRDFMGKNILPYVDNEKVKLFGVLEHHQMIQLVQQAKVVLCPIHWEEPFGLVMIEAMACGTPVIAYGRGSVPEIVVDGVTGFIIDPPEEDASDLAFQKRPLGTYCIKKRGIEGIVEALKRIGQIDRSACRKHVEDHFTAEKMVSGYERVYNQILQST